MCYCNRLLVTEYLKTVKIVFLSTSVMWLNWTGQKISEEGQTAKVKM